MAIVGCWTLATCFAVLLCGAASNGDRADQADRTTAGGSVSDALASLTTQP
jgi:hypothetical protein